MGIVAVDAGTTEIKAVAYDDTGAEARVARRRTQVRAGSPDAAEQDPHQVWDAVAGAVREVAPAAGTVAALAVTGQGDGCWLVRPDGEPAGPAVLWNDGRAAPIVAQWQRDGRVEQAFRINGSVAFPGSPHAALAWLARHQPERVAAAGTVLTCTGWLFQRLTGQTAVDESEAAAPWLEITRREYSPEILDLFDLAWAGRLLPPLRREHERVAALSGRAADHLGMPAGTPVVLAPYDLVATSAGAGATADRQACAILGTTLSTQAVVGSADTGGTPLGLTIPMAGRYLRALPTLAGTQVLSWAADLLGLADAAEVPALAAGAAPGAGSLVFLPYLSPAGERAPFVDASASGGFAGLSWRHGRDQVARAVLEGLTYVIRDCVEVGDLRPTRLHLCGGGAASASWCQLIADVVGVPVTRSADREVGARGAYCYALVATGELPDLTAAAAAHTRTAGEFHPDPDRRRAYDTLFAEFRAVRVDAARSWPRLAQARSRDRQ